MGRLVVGEDTLARVQTRRGGGETPGSLAEPSCTSQSYQVAGGVITDQSATFILRSALAGLGLSILLTGTPIKT